MRPKTPPRPIAPLRVFRLKFFSETYTELTKAVWPTRQELLRLTLMVLSISVVVGLFLGAVDYGLTLLAKFILP